MVVKLYMFSYKHQPQNTWGSRCSTWVKQQYFTLSVTCEKALAEKKKKNSKKANQEVSFKYEHDISSQVKKKKVCSKADNTHNLNVSRTEMCCTFVLLSVICGFHCAVNFTLLSLCMKVVHTNLKPITPKINIIMTFFFSILCQAQLQNLTSFWCHCFFFKI